MRPIPDARRVLQRAWSVRLFALAAVLAGLEAVLPSLEFALPIPATAYRLIVFAVTAGGLAVRFIAQRKLENPECQHSKDRV